MLFEKITMKKNIKNKIWIIVPALLLVFSLGVWFAYSQQEETKIDEDMDVARDLFIGGDAKIEGYVRGYVVPSSVTWTSTAHNGNFGGYKAMNDWIQENGCEGYHVCDGTEVVRYQQHHGPINVNSSWYNAGRGTYNSSVHIRDCIGWTHSGSDRAGGVFYGNYGGYSRPSSATCNNSRRVLCCKY